MRILVVGAGAIGGYFGGRLLQADCDVTFLVRPGREVELAASGLVIKSPNGNVVLKNLRTVRADTMRETFDVVLLSCKAYDLTDAVKSFAPAVGPTTVILPLLNGLAHLDQLDRKFGRERVLGGLSTIVVTLNERREVVQLHPIQTLIYGERDGGFSDRVRGIEEVVQVGNFSGGASENVVQDMWEKWVFLGSLAAATSLMRASIGTIVASPGGKDFVRTIMEECKSVAGATGYPPRVQFIEHSLSMLTGDGSTLMASMSRDMIAGHQVEADHIIGDLIAHADRAMISVPLLRVAYTNLKSYELQRG